MTIEDLVRELDGEAASGLTVARATRRFGQWRPNRLPEGEDRSVASRARALVLDCYRPIAPGVIGLESRGVIISRRGIVDHAGIYR